MNLFGAIMHWMQTILWIYCSSIIFRIYDEAEMNVNIHRIISIAFIIHHMREFITNRNNHLRELCYSGTSSYVKQIWLNDGTTIESNRLLCDLTICSKVALTCRSHHTVLLFFCCSARRDSVDTPSINSSWKDTDWTKVGAGYQIQFKYWRKELCERVAKCYERFSDATRVFSAARFLGSIKQT